MPLHVSIRIKCYRGAPWLSGRASDSGASGREFETYLRRVVSLSKTLFSPKVLVIPRKRLLRPNMTEKLLTGTLNLKTNKHQMLECLVHKILHQLMLFTCFLSLSLSLPLSHFIIFKKVIPKSHQQTRAQTI